MDNLFIQRILISREPEGYLRHLPVVKNLKKRDGLSFEAPITFLVGENGTGKSTLLEAIAIAWGFNPEGGSRNFQFVTNDTHSGLDVKIWRGFKHPADGFFLRAESFYNVASYIDQIDDPAHGFLDGYGGISLHEQSHGESFLSLVLHRFRGDGLYILDEPEAALSPARQMSMLVRIHDLAKSGSQFIIATHSPILTACPDAILYQLTEDGITQTPYQKTENYLLSRCFLENPQRMVSYLLKE